MEQGELFLRLAKQCKQEHYRLKNAVPVIGGQD
jgi:hypothetical protein